MRSTFLFLLALWCFACAPDLRVDHPFDGETKSGPLVSAEGDGRSMTVLHVDATNKAAKVYVDLDAARELKSEEAFATNAWDVAVKRFEISINGGTSSPRGTVRALVVKGGDFESMTQAPAEGYVQDGTQSVFSDLEGGWYFYDLGVHRLTPRRELFYVLQTSAGSFVKLQMLGYYDASGTPAVVSWRYAPVSPP